MKGYAVHDINGNRMRGGGISSLSSAILVLTFLLSSLILLEVNENVVSAEPASDGVIISGEYDDLVIIEDEKFEVHWTIIDEIIYMGLRAKSTGWLSLGFEPTDGMKDADMIFGWVTSGGDAEMRDAYSTGTTGPHPEDGTLGGTDDLESIEGAESGGWTTIEFRRDLDTGDQYDHPISTSSSTTVIWAFGSTDDWNSIHSDRGDGTITFTKSVPPTPTSNEFDGIIDTGEYGNQTSFDVDRFQLYWEIIGEEIIVGIKAQTTGWVSLGIDPTDRMKDADMIFGWVDPNSVPGIADAYSTGATGPHPVDDSLGGTFDILAYNATEIDGWTTLEFRRNLSTGDIYDKDIQMDTTMTIIWAVGSSDGFNSMHSRDGTGTWRVDPLPPPPPPPQPSDEFDGIITEGEYPNLQKFDSDRFELRWKMNDTNILIGLRAQTTGWISIGMDPTDRMKDADMIFGWKTPAGTAGAEDTYSTGPTGPHPTDIDLGGTFDIAAYNITESGGWTTMEFRRDLSTGDEYDKDIPFEGQVTMIWGVGESDDIDSMHTRRGSGTWDTSVEVTDPDHISDLDGIITENEYRNMTAFDSNRFELHWMVDGSEIYIGMRAQAIGYISMGIDPTNKMDESDMILGWVDTNGRPVVLDMYSTGPLGPHPVDTTQGGTDDILDYNGTEINGWTTLEIRRELVTGDATDKDISLTELMTIIWAVSDTDDQAAAHTRRGTLTWKVVVEEDPEPEPGPSGDHDGSISSDEYQETQVFEGGVFTVHWRIDGDEIHFGMEAETTGWLSIGFEPTNIMKDADMIFGWVDSEGTPHTMDTYSTGEYGPHPPDTDLGGTNDIISFNGTQTTDMTIIEFSRKLDTGDTYDKIIVKNSSVNIIWGISDTDDYLDTHTDRGSGTLLLSQNVPEPSSDLDGIVDPGEYEASATFDFDGFRIYWTIGEDVINMAITADTLGWISIGFDHEDAKNNSDIVFGWVDDDGSVNIIDAYSIGPYGPHPPDTHLGGTTDFIEYNGTEIDGKTTLEFSRKLATGDIYDKDIPAQGTLKIIWAYSETDDFSDSHSKRGYGVLTIGDPGNIGDDDKTGGLDGLIFDDEYDFNGTFGDGILTIYWKVDGDEINIGMVGKTTGWISIGFGYTTAMEDSDMIFGWVEDDGTVKVVDTYSTGPTGPHPEDTDQGGTDDVIDFGGREINGITTIEFIRKLVTGDNRDNPIPTNGTLQILWATSSSDSFNSIHDHVGYGTMNIETGETTSRGSNTLWPIHAFFMTLGVGGMVAATIILFRRKWKYFFKFHMWVMSGSVISLSIGIISGFIMVQASTGSHIRVLHSWFGLLTLFVAVSSLGFALYFKYSKDPKYKKITRSIHKYSGWAGVVMMILTALSGFIQALFL